MAATALPPQPVNSWALWTDSQGDQHKCLRQKLWASCVPACMAMIVRAISLNKQKYQEETARGALRAIIGPKQYEAFSLSGISLKNVPEAFMKADVKNAVYVTGANVDGAFCAQYFSAEKPGMVGVDITVGHSTFRHCMMCKGPSPAAISYLSVPPTAPTKSPPETSPQASPSPITGSSALPRPPPPRPPAAS